MARADKKQNRTANAEERGGAMAMELQDIGGATRVLRGKALDVARKLVALGHVQTSRNFPYDKI